MAVEIKSGNSTDLATVDPTSKAIRVTNYASDGHEGLHSFPIALAANTATALNEFILPSLDASEYKFLSIQLTGTWVGTVIFEGCNDNTTFYSIATTDPSANNTGQTTATDNRIVKVPVITKYIRARVSAYTSGAISATIFGHLDENSSGLISTLGNVTLNAETTKKIGNVGIEAGTSLNVVVTAPDTLETDVYTSLAPGGAGSVANSRNIKSSATTLRSMVMTSFAATSRIIKIYDNSGINAAGTNTPAIVVAIKAGGTFSYPIPAEGLPFTNGMAMCMVLFPADTDATDTGALAGDVLLTSIFSA
jgi:hypothetical protein